MSYCRPWRGCNVYMFPSENGIVCMCNGKEHLFTTRSAAIEHLLLDHSDNVPEDAIDILKKEIELYGDDALNFEPIN